MPKPETPEEFIRRYPAVTAHLVAESLGYFTPESAAGADLDGLHGRENWCEYIFTCFNKDARACLQQSIRNRHYHSGPMAEYKLARKLVDHYIETGHEPVFASWF